MEELTVGAVPRVVCKCICCLFPLLKLRTDQSQVGQLIFEAWFSSISGVFFLFLFWLVIVLQSIAIEFVVSQVSSALGVNLCFSTCFVLKLIWLESYCTCLIIGLISFNSLQLSFIYIICCSHELLPVTLKIKFRLETKFTWTLDKLEKKLKKWLATKRVAALAFFTPIWLVWFSVFEPFKKKIQRCEAQTYREAAGNKSSL